ncbi:MAG: nitroreductase family protein [Promethearchaeati archaeon]
MIRKTIKAIKYLFLAFYKNPKRIKNSKLEAMLRFYVHTVEKSRIDQDKSDPLFMVLGRKYFSEAKKRKLLSKDEIEWCESILYGKQREKKPKEISNQTKDNLQSIIKERRSVRSWEGSELNKNDFEKIVNMAKWAPSSCNRQPWHFVLVNDKETIKLISELRNQKFLINAPSCVLALINMETYNGKEINYTPYLDAGAAIQNLLLAAESLGYGACWVNFGKMEVSDNKRAILRKVINLPDELKIISVIAIGKNPTSKPKAPGRKNSNDIIHLEKF